MGLHGLRFLVASGFRKVNSATAPAGRHHRAVVPLPRSWSSIMGGAVLQRWRAYGAQAGAGVFSFARDCSEFRGGWRGLAGGVSSGPATLADSLVGFPESPEQLQSSK